MTQVDGYIDRVLAPGETVLYRARVHWAVFIKPVVLSIGALFLLLPVSAVFPDLGSLAVVIALGGVLGVGLAWMRQITDELVLTDRRVVVKNGWLTRSTFELRLEQLESVQVHQSVLGRLLDYGTLYVMGTGGFVTPVSMIEAPLRFRAALSEIVAGRGIGTGTPPGMTVNAPVGDPEPARVQRAKRPRVPRHWR